MVRQATFKIMFCVIVLVAVGLAGCESKPEFVSLSDFENSLNGNGITSFEKSETFHQMVKAADGAKYKINGEIVEVYQYDQSGMEYLDLIAKDGLMGNVVLKNKNLALLENSAHTDWSKIEKAFNSF